MKKILISFVSILIIFSACQTTSKETNTSDTENVTTKTDGTPKFKFEKTKYDFGKLIQGEKVSYTFKFENIGDANLIIEDIRTSCGCTVPEYTEKPIAPNKNGDIKITFNTTGKLGKQHKTITILSNTREPYELLITANVVLP